MDMTKEKKKELCRKRKKQREKERAEKERQKKARERNDRANPNTLRKKKQHRQLLQHIKNGEPAKNAERRKKEYQRKVKEFCAAQVERLRRRQPELREAVVSYDYEKKTFSIKRKLEVQDARDSGKNAAKGHDESREPGKQKGDRQGPASNMAEEKTMVDEPTPARETAHEERNEKDSPVC